jgi:hypothetical protein
LKLTRYHQKPWGQKYEGKDKRKKTVYAKPRGAGHMHRLLVYNKKRTRKRTKKKLTPPDKYASSQGKKRKRQQIFPILNEVHDTTTTKRSAVGNAWAGWGSIPIFFSP